MANVRPIVVNKEMVVLGGNMRLKAMQEAGWSEVPVQVVDWSEEKQREFIIKDNVGFGEWDWDELANTWDAEELNEWGLDVPNLEEIDKLEDGEEIELPQSVQLEPPMEYILVMAEPNSVEWEELKETLQLRMVRRGGYKKGSAFDAVALERVLNWNDLKERLNANSSTK
jgi:ParB-like chromosome segregation protein Spo0J